MGISWKNYKRGGGQNISNKREGGIYAANVQGEPNLCPVSLDKRHKVGILYRLCKALINDSLIASLCLLFYICNSRCAQLAQNLIHISKETKRNTCDIKARTVI